MTIFESVKASQIYIFESYAYVVVLYYQNGKQMDVYRVDKAKIKKKNYQIYVTFSLT